MRRCTATIITIGSELLKGNIENTNAQFLARELTRLGFEVLELRSCRDCASSIEICLSSALSQSDFIVLTGGLGPTPDDVTREAISRFFKVPLSFSKSQYACIREYYRKYGCRVPSVVRKEAYYPENARPLINRHGIALGFSIPCGNRLVAVLPGVPYELERMYEEALRPLLKKFFRNLKRLPSLVVRTVGISEPEIIRRLGSSFFRGAFEFGIYPQTGEVAIQVYAQRLDTLRRLRSIIKRRLSSSTYAFEDVSLSEIVGRLLVRKRKTLSVAESCSGGFLAAEITKVPGSSRYFLGGVSAYDNRVKLQLGVPKKILDRKGAVSREVAQMLAEQIRKKLKTDYGLGITGVAGPGGGSRQKPVGLVYVALASSRTCYAEKCMLWGGRKQIQARASKKALELIWRNLVRRPKD